MYFSAKTSQKNYFDVLDAEQHHWSLIKVIDEVFIISIKTIRDSCIFIHWYSLSFSKKKNFKVHDGVLVGSLVLATSEGEVHCLTEPSRAL